MTEPTRCPECGRDDVEFVVRWIFRTWTESRWRCGSCHYEWETHQRPVTALGRQKEE